MTDPTPILEDESRLPENAFRELAPGETYEPVIPPSRPAQEITTRSIVQGFFWSIVFSAAATLPESSFQQVRKALFAVNAETVAAVDGEVLKVLKSALVDGFVPLEEKEFDLVREMAKRCNLPPYDKY